MLRIDNITVKVVTLLFLPAYFFFLNSSMRSYHSHIFASGIVVTHSHPDCNNDESNTNPESGEDEIVIFHGLMQTLTETAKTFVFVQPSPRIVTVVENPPISYTNPILPGLKLGRAPPAQV